jgi:AraC-like DNA-binding protein
MLDVPDDSLRRLHEVVRTDLLDPPDRFDVWHSLVARDLMPARFRSPRAHDFTASLRAASLGSVTVTAMNHPPLEVTRTATHVRQGDPECYFLTLNLAGSQHLSQNDNTSVIKPGDLTVYHSSLPLTTRPDPAISRESAVLITLPAAELHLPHDVVRPLLGTTFDGTTGLSGVLGTYLRSLAYGTALAETDDHPRLGQIGVDLVTVLLAQRTTQSRQVPPETTQRALLARVQTYIIARLGEESLTPEAVAAAHHVSARTLQRAFRSQGTSVANWIRWQRLRRCQLDLADPTLSALPIAAIGRRWGFADPAHFNRTFKSAYGIPPGACRAGEPPSDDGEQTPDGDEPLS